MVAREGLGTLDYELLANPQHIQAVSGLVTAVIYQDVITIKQYALHAVACHFDNRERFRVGTQVDTNPIFPKSHCESWFFVFSDITMSRRNFNVVAWDEDKFAQVHGITERIPHLRGSLDALGVPFCIIARDRLLQLLITTCCSSFREPARPRAALPPTGTAPPVAAAALFGGQRRIGRQHAHVSAYPAKAGTVLD